MLPFKLRSVLSLLVAFGLASQVCAQGHFLRGDTNKDGLIDVTDPIVNLGFQFLGDSPPPCQDAADFNDDGTVDITDAIGNLEFQFLGQAPPAPPYPGFELDPTDDDGVSCGNVVEVADGEITGDVSWTKENVYLLQTPVFVNDGATLEIEEGTTVLGLDRTFVAVLRGGKLIAEGSPAQPIVFSSAKAFGERARGDWGGLVILGRGDNNKPGKEALAEGLENDFWGGAGNVIENDNSGILRYVRVEFGGFAISENNEVNAISLFGVGSQTQLDHIMTKYNSDDGYEWFGGNCSLKYALAVGIGDDSFDYSFGWSGMGQFWVAQQRGDDADRGFEVDNSEDEFGARPLTRPMLSNVTLVGDPSDDPGRPESTTGITLRRGAGTILYNSIITGFKNEGLDLDDIETVQNDAADLIVDHCVFQGNLNGAFEEGDDETGFPFTTAEFGRTINTNNVEATDPPLVDPFNLDNPNFRPQNDALTETFDPTSLNSFFEPASYKGAVPPVPGADWTQASWISYAQN